MTVEVTTEDLHTAFIMLFSVALLIAGLFYMVSERLEKHEKICDDCSVCKGRMSGLGAKPPKSQK